MVVVYTTEAQRLVMEERTIQATNVLRRIGGIGLALAVSLMATTSGAWAATESMQATTATNIEWGNGSYRNALGAIIGEGITTVASDHAWELNVAGTMNVSHPVTGNDSCSFSDSYNTSNGSATSNCSDFGSASGARVVVDTNHTWSDGGAPILKTFHTDQIH